MEVYGEAVDTRLTATANLVGDLFAGSQIRLVSKNGENQPKSLKTRIYIKRQPLAMQGVASLKYWYRRVELNHRPMGYESIALNR